MVTRESSRPASAKQRLKELGIELPTAPEPFGTYVEAVQTGSLLLLTGMLPTGGRAAKFIGRVGAELDVEAGRKAARLAALNALAVTSQYLGSLDKVTRIVRLGVAVATSADVREQPRVADGPVSCDVVAVNEGGAKEPAMSSPIDDSGDGACYVELFEPAQKTEQLLRDGFMPGSSPGVAAAYSDARGKYMLFKAVAKATMIRLLQAERRRLSG